MNQKTRKRPPKAHRIGLCALVLTSAALPLSGCAKSSDGSLPPHVDGPTSTVAPPVLRGEIHGSDRPFDLEGQRGKVVLVDFWASWCEPCKRELPEIAALVERHAASDLVVIGVNEDDALADAERFASERGGLGIPWIHDRDKSIAKVWRPEKMPTLFLIERDGTLGPVFAGESTTLIADLESAIAERAKNP